MSEIKKISAEFTKNLIKKADKIFEGRIKDVKSVKEIKQAINEGLMARCNFCSIENLGVKCAEIIKENTGAEVRGTKLDETKMASGKCIVCGKNAEKTVYIAKSY